MIQPCPNGGKCGARTHDVSKAQFHECKRLAFGGSAPAAVMASAPVLQSPEPVDPVGSSDFEAAIKSACDAAGEAETASYHARKKAFAAQIEAAMVVARATCKSLESMKWTGDDEGGQSTTLALFCGCEQAECDPEDGLDADGEFLEAHGIDSWNAQGALDSRPDKGDFESFHWEAGLNEPSRHDYKWTRDFFDEHVTALGVDESNQPARDFLREHAWSTLTPESPEVVLAKTLHPDV